jgi:hypothetical protein
MQLGTRRKAPARLDNARKLQRMLYRVAKQQPERRFTLLYDKVCRQDILQEAWRRVKSNKGASGVDEVDIDEIRELGGVPIFGSATATGFSIRSIGPCRVSCSYGSDANTNAVGGRRGSTGTISSYTNGVGCIKW